jgi:hypothetical protein
MTVDFKGVVIKQANDNNSIHVILNYSYQFDSNNAAVVESSSAWY